MKRLHAMPFGAAVVAHGVSFRLWASAGVSFSSSRLWPRNA